MDGVLINSELLKAYSYAYAVKSLRHNISENTVVKAYMNALGGSTLEVSSSIIHECHLYDQVNINKVSALARKHKEAYRELLSNPDRLWNYRHPEAIKALKLCRKKNLKTALVTGSSRDSMDAITTALEISDCFDFILTADDVKKTKPDPESYITCSSYFGVDPGDLVVIEDSLTGIKSALSAGTFCIAVETEFTTSQLRKSKLLNECNVITNHTNLIEVVKKLCV